MIALTPDTYVPSLRWRCGEYQALNRLEDSAKDRVVPFVLIPEIEFDFEERRPKKSVQDHVNPFPKRYHMKWDYRPAWIDAHPKIASTLMSDGKLPIAHVFDELRTIGSAALPVTSLDASPAINVAVTAIVDADRRGVGIRARLEHVMKPTFGTLLGGLLNTIGVVPAEADLILDLGAPNYEPYDDFADGLAAAMDGVADLADYRSFVLLGTSYPASIDLDKPGGDLPRHDWAFFKVLRDKLRDAGRIPNYGDYTIVHPDFTPRDMRMVKSGGKIVYTSDGFWVVRKGGAFRDNPGQMHDHCAHIVASGKFRGSAFSAGDAYIEQCANRTVPPSTLTRWKEIGINHHIMHVLDDLSSLAFSA